MAPEKAVEQFFQIPSSIASSFWSKVKEIFVPKNLKNSQNLKDSQNIQNSQNEQNSEYARISQNSENGNIIKKEDPEKPEIRSNRRPPLSERVSEALLKRHLSDRKNVPKNFNSIVLKFPKIDRALLQVRKVFEKTDSSHTGSLSLPQLSLALSSLQLRVTSSEACDICHAADLDRSGGIGLREFFLAVAFVVLLEGEEGEGEEKKDSRVGLPSLGAAFETIFDAFFFFDSNRDGVLSQEEVAKSFSLSLSCEKEGTKLQSFTNRFDEMDYDHNGECTFTEFVYAFVGWVGTAEDEEEEDEDEKEDEKVL